MAAIESKKDENGQVVFRLAEGSYRFRAHADGHSHWSLGMCGVPDCESAAIVLSTAADIVVTVTDGSGAPLWGVQVKAYRGESDTGISQVTDENGQAGFDLPQGSYHFRAEYNGQTYWSAGACSQPGCDRAWVTAQGNREQKITYSYDALNRLIGAEYEDGRSFHYTYDAAGNRLSETALLAVGVDPIENTYVYDDANRLAEVNAVEYTWDANGNLLDDGVSAYTYDDANRLVEIESGSTTASYAYTGLGDRLQSTENGTTTTYHLDLAAGLTQVLDDGQHTYLYGNGRIGYSSDDMYYFLGDALGSVRAVVQGDGDAPVVMTRDYAPYGEVLAGQGTNPTRYGYTGEWADVSGLVYLRARYYSPYINQFIQPDPIVPNSSSPSSLNRYIYVRANPVNFTDPSGYDYTCPTCEPSNARDLTHWLYEEMTSNANNHWSVKVMKAENELAIMYFVKGSKELNCNRALALLYFSQATATHGSALTLFYFMVRDGGPWDFKDEIGLRLGPGITICDSSSNCYEDIEYSVPGNIHYGYIGLAAGFPAAEIKFGAGWAEKNDSSHDPNNPAYSGPYLGEEDYSSLDEDEWNYGDEAHDNAAVILGIKMWRKGQENLTFAEYQEMIGTKVSELDRCPPSKETVSSDIKKLWPYSVGYFNNQGRIYVKAQGVCQ